jgi:hypothetical protein
MRILNVSNPDFKTDCPYKYSFTLVTASRDFELYAPTVEERDLWVEAFYRLF